MSKDEIPTWSADGRRRRSVSRAAAERLDGLSLVSAQRNRRGAILAIHFRDADGGSSLRATAKLGQRYSFLDRVSPVARVWAHKKLPVTESDFRRVIEEIAA